MALTLDFLTRQINFGLIYETCQQQGVRAIIAYINIKFKHISRCVYSIID